jgi:hypothetical protein
MKMSLNDKIIFDGNAFKTQVSQDISGILDQTALDREYQESNGKSKNYRKIATIPDIVAIEILTKYGLDLHAPDFMHHPANGRKLRQILKSEYPKLLLNT